MTHGQKPHKPQGLRNWIKSKLRRSGTLKVAMAILRLVDLVARIIDWFW
jgi:hypothetical protein